MPDILSRWLLVVVIVLGGSIELRAQTVYYGPNGQYLGLAQPLGQSTIYYGPTGKFIGQAMPLTPPAPMTPWMPPPVTWQMPSLPVLPALPIWGQ